MGYSLKVTLTTIRPELEEDSTIHVIGSNFNKKSTQELLPMSLGKLFKCGTSEHIKPKLPNPNKHIERVSSKDNLYLTDQQPTIKNNAYSSINLQGLFLNEEQDSQLEIKSLAKFEALMTESQKKNFKLSSTTFEYEFPNETDTREVLTEDNMLKLLKRFFHLNYLFWNVNETSIKEALPFIFLKKFKPSTIILNEGETPYNFFIIQSGIIVKNSMRHGKKLVKYLDKGKMFGEKSLFDQMKRTSTYVSEGNCLLWGINIATFFKMLNTANLENFNENRRIIDKISVFRFISNKMKDEIAHNIYEQKFPKGSMLLEEDSVCACCFLVKKGEILMKSAKNGIEKVFKQGDYIGDWSLNSFYFQSGLEASFKEDVTVLTISNKKLRNILGDNLFSLNWKNLSRIAFSQSPFFSRFSSEILEKIIDNLQICCYEKNQTIIPKGTPVDSLYVALDGNLKKRSGEIIEEASIIGEECALFGEPFLLRKSSLKKDESVIMDTNGILGEISRTNIERITGVKFSQVNEPLGSFIFNSQNSINSCEKLSELSSAISQDEIEVLEIIGEGQFGLVFLVRVKENYYALKMCAKAYIISRRFELYLINEKMIQSSYGEFPFLIKFHKSFQDENLVFFLMDYIDGQDLSSIYYSGTNTFSCEVTRFYVSQLILTVEYLHSKDIVHRDIKLNNILVDQFGFIKLIDFGIAKVMKNGGRTFTIVGTPHYMAPEIILGKGYDNLVDFWAIGVCMYEMLFGRLPFGDQTEDPIEVYSSIIGTKQPNFDKYKAMNLSYGTFDLLLKLLNKDMSKRIGRGKTGCKELKEHSWFNNFDWKLLLNKKLKSFHPQQEKNLEKMKGKKLAQHLKEDEMQNYLKKEEKRLSMIQGWDDVF